MSRSRNGAVSRNMRPPISINARDGHAKILHGSGAVVPLGLIFVVFAVANRHLVTVSFDPFNSSDPSVAVTLPLFVVIIAVAIVGVVAGGSATWFRQRRWRRAARQHEADARQARAQLADLRASAATLRGTTPQRLPGAAAGRRLRGRRARQAGRDVVERGPHRLALPGPAAAQPVPLKHVADRQNLWPVHARDPRCRAAGRRGHGWIRVLSAVAAPYQPGDRARSRPAGQGPRRQRWR